MTGKAIDSSATAILVLILPIAFLIVVLFKIWPLLLVLSVFSIGLRGWQQYQWKQWCQQVTPYFNELIKENQGCLTVTDLSMRASLSGSDAQRFLDKQAEDFGAQRLVYEDRGTVYYFLTASALGSIFANSDPSPELQSESFTSQPLALIEPQKESQPSASDSAVSQVSQPVEPPEPKESKPVETHPERKYAINYFPDFDESEDEEVSESDDGALDKGESDRKLPIQPQEEHTEAHTAQDDALTISLSTQEENPQSLIQAELAKRLDVHPSTIGKRKSDPDFAEWSQSRDPDGIAWEYSSETKEFLPVNKIV